MTEDGTSKLCQRGSKQVYGTPRRWCVLAQNFEDCMFESHNLHYALEWLNTRHLCWENKKSPIALAHSRSISALLNVDRCCIPLMPLASCVPDTLPAPSRIQDQLWREPMNRGHAELHPSPGM